MEVGWGGEGGMVGNIGLLASHLSHLTESHRPQKDILPNCIILYYTDLLQAVHEGHTVPEEVVRANLLPASDKYLPFSYFSSVSEAFLLCQRPFLCGLTRDHNQSPPILPPPTPGHRQSDKDTK